MTLPYKVKVEHPYLGEQKLLIQGLGTFDNNSETTVDDDKVTHFVSVHGKEPEFAKMFGVTVTKVANTEGGDQ
jgi:hypothetical protein